MCGLEVGAWWGAHEYMPNVVFHPAVSPNPLHPTHYNLLLASTMHPLCTPYVSTTHTDQEHFQRTIHQ